MKSIDFISESAPYRDILYSKLRQMKSRCNHPSNPEYKNYGGRGIKVCDEWNDYRYGFLAFYAWSITHGYQKGLSIDRINVNGDYEPNNCRYIPMEEQINNRRSTVWIWQDNKPIQLLLYCTQNDISKNKYISLRKKIIKGKISPMTLKPYSHKTITRYILVDNKIPLTIYCEWHGLDYNIMLHILNTIYPEQDNITSRELKLYITYFYHETAQY